MSAFAPVMSVTKRKKKFSLWLCIDQHSCGVGPSSLEVVTGFVARSHEIGDKYFAHSGKLMVD